MNTIFNRENAANNTAMSKRSTGKGSTNKPPKPSLQKIFQQFRLGAMLFFAGLVAIYCVQQLVTPSLKQELLILLSLLVTGTGFCIAMIAQVRFVIGRLILFFSNQ